MRSIFITFLLLFPLLSNAQASKWEIYIAPSYTFIGNQKKSSPNQSVYPSSGYTSNGVNVTIEELYRGNIGIEMGARISKTILKNLSIKSGADVSLKRFKRTESVSMPIVDRENVISLPGMPIGSFYGTILGSTGWRDSSGHLITLLPINQREQDHSRLGETNALYLQIPIVLHYTLNKKISIEAGIQLVSLLLAAQYRVSQNYIYSQGNFIPEKSSWDTSSDGLTNSLLNVSGRVSYALSQKLRIYTDYQRSLSAIYDEPRRIAGKARFNTTSLGICYQF